VTAAIGIADQKRLFLPAQMIPPDLPKIWSFLVIYGEYNYFYLNIKKYIDK
jgi:hypothetical protein